ncbi:hypothetical protein [Aliikangiella coralliicola]|nr:hypothetical protein [Aliikangiella coralliicola]
MHLSSQAKDSIKHLTDSVSYAAIASNSPAQNISVVRRRRTYWAGCDGV